MDCKTGEKLMQDLIDNELDEQIADEVSMHVFACDSCEAKFEKLQTEKEIYTQFLFEIEPPKDLPQKFQARLQTLEPKKSVASISFGERLAAFLFAWNFTPLMATACLLLIFAFVYFGVKKSSENTEQQIVETKEMPRPISVLPSENKQFKETEITKVTTQSNRPAKNKESVLKVRKEFETKPRVISAKENPTKQKPLKQLQKLETADENLKEYQAFDMEVAKQKEKIEMLLRSFRNSRFDDEKETYEVAYEKQQARKLLEQNVKLREKADLYGDFFALETLEKVETYLLDIANLDDTPREEDVLDIKQRVKNQSVIASLQGY